MKGWFGTAGHGEKNSNSNNNSSPQARSSPSYGRRGSQNQFPSSSHSPADYVHVDRISSPDHGLHFSTPADRLISNSKLSAVPLPSPEEAKEKSLEGTKSHSLRSVSDLNPATAVAHPLPVNPALKHSSRPHSSPESSPNYTKPTVSPGVAGPSPHATNSLSLNPYSSKALSPRTLNPALLSSAGSSVNASALPTPDSLPGLSTSSSNSSSPLGSLGPLSSGSGQALVTNRPIPVMNLPSKRGHRFASHSQSGLSTPSPHSGGDPVRLPSLPVPGDSGGRAGGATGVEVGDERASLRGGRAESSRAVGEGRGMPLPPLPPLDNVSAGNAVPLSPSRSPQPLPLAALSVPSKSGPSVEVLSSELVNRAPRMGGWKKYEPPLGSGSFGTVYKGFNKENGTLFAVKEVPLSGGHYLQEESLRQINQELLLLSQLSHPNIVQYQGTLTDERNLYIFLEYMPGGSIHRLLEENGKFSDPLIRTYTRQIVSGLSYLHGMKTVHRDIKGANLLVDTNGQVKLADFGMAKSLKFGDYSKSFDKGSSYWMAPEVLIRSDTGYDLAVDIWSLGCTVLEMATGKPPWWPLEGIQAMFKIASGEELPPFPSDLSPHARDFVLRCLQRSPETRPSAQLLLEHPFVKETMSIPSMISPPHAWQEDGSRGRDNGVKGERGGRTQIGIDTKLGDLTVDDESIRVGKNLRPTTEGSASRGGQHIQKWPI